MRRRFTLRVERRPSILHLNVTGDFDRSGVAETEAALHRLIRRDTRLVVFDLRHVELLDLAGLGAIFDADERAQASWFDVVVVQPRGSANHVLVHTRAAERLTMIERAPATA